MAFSMFMCTPASSKRILAQNVLKVVSQPRITQKPLTTAAVRNVILNNFKRTTPILAKRTFQTSPVRMAMDHSKLWVAEKGVSLGLGILVPLGLLMPNKLFDLILAVMIGAHSHWGLEAIVIDYVRPSICGPVIPKVALALVYLASVCTLGGLFYLITHDIGIGNTLRRLWAIKSNDQK